MKQLLIEWDDDARQVKIAVKPELPPFDQAAILFVAAIMVARDNDLDWRRALDSVWVAEPLWLDEPPLATS